MLRILFGTVKVALLSIILTSCGYQLQGGGSVLPPDVKQVYIPLVENNSTEAQLTLLMTEALRDRFERFGVLTVTDSANEADAILKARIKGLKKEVRSSTAGTDTALQYDLVITVAAELQKIGGGLLYRESDMRISRAYGATSGTVVTSSADFAGGSLSGGDLGSLDSREVSRGQEQELYLEIADLVAKRIYDEAVAPDF